LASGRPWPLSLSLPTCQHSSGTTRCHPSAGLFKEHRQIRHLSILGPLIKRSSDSSISLENICSLLARTTEQWNKKQTCTISNSIKIREIKTLTKKTYQVTTRHETLLGKFSEDINKRTETAFTDWKGAHCWDRTLSKFIRRPHSQSRPVTQ
jgi:hypothetical protein